MTLGVYHMSVSIGAQDTCTFSHHTTRIGTVRTMYIHSSTSHGYGQQ